MILMQNLRVKLLSLLVNLEDASNLRILKVSISISFILIEMEGFRSKK